MSGEKLEQSIIYFHPHPNHDKIKHATKIHQEKNVSSFNQKLAVAFTKYFGSMGMFWALVIWMFVWMTLATLGIWLFKNDKYPFPFLLFCSNLVQLWALPVLAVGQNVLSKQQEAHAEATYENTKASLDQEKLSIEHLNAQDKELIYQTQAIKEIQERLQTAIQYLSHEINDLKIQQEKMLKELGEKYNTVELKEDEEIKPQKRRRGPTFSVKVEDE